MKIGDSIMGGCENNEENMLIYDYTLFEIHEENSYVLFKEELKNQEGFECPKEIFKQKISS